MIVVRPSTWRLAAIAILLALMASTVGLLVKLYNGYQKASAVPTPPADVGSVRLFFDRPSVSAILEVRMRDYEFEEGTTVEYQITFEDDYTGKAARFFLVLAGKALAPETYPNGDREVDSQGCWPGTSVFRDTTNSWTCYTTKLGPGLGYSSPELQTPAQVISGVIDRDQPAHSMAQITTYLRVPFSESAGKRTYFTLPSIGTPYVPTGIRSDITSDLGRDKHTYVPSRVDLGIDYGELPPTAKFDSVVPEPYKVGAKYWIQLDAAMVAAHGSVIDTVAEEQFDKDIFLYGTFVGIAASALPILGTGVFRLLRSSTRKPVTQHDCETQPDTSPSPDRPAQLLTGTELLRQQLQRYRLKDLKSQETRDES